MNPLGTRRTRQHRILLLAIVFVSAAAWPQTENPPAQPPVPPVVSDDNGIVPAGTSVDVTGDRMLTPPPVSGATYSVELNSEERSNYLQGGLSLTTAYSDNLVGRVGHSSSDISYSVAPSIALNKTTTRLHGIFTYAPGFTFYQRVSDYNETDHNALVDLQYRLSSHVTLSARDSFQKSSTIFNQANLLSTGTVNGGAQGPTFAAIAPVADHISNLADVGLSYQFALNGMIGVSGSSTYLDYPHPKQVPGLYNSESQSGRAFYSKRISKVHYLGATYQYQRLMSYPAEGLSQTQTHALLFFYTLYPSTTLSFSFFGGPQRSTTVEPSLAPIQLHSGATPAWYPAAGASMNWQGQRSSFALSYSHLVSAGGGLVGAVRADSALLSFRQRITRTLTGVLDGGYAQDNVLATASEASSNGHRWSGTASLQQELGLYLTLGIGYSRIHQTYNVPVISSTPDTNREFISLSYRFSRPVGR